MNEVYVCEKDIVVVGDESRLIGPKDDHGILLAAKGKKIPMAVAIRLGLVGNEVKIDEGDTDEDTKAYGKSQNKKGKKGEDK